MDQAGFEILRATGRHQLMQITWVYEHAVNLDGLKRFHRDFGYGAAGRRIERSPLPFGRHRWVSWLGPQSDLDFAPFPRPRAELGDWVDERAQLPVDPELGPGWHIGVLPMTDGSTAISLVASHNLGDGVAGMLTIFDGVMGTKRQFGFPPPRYRSRRRAVAADLRETLHGLPEIGRTLGRAMKLLSQQGFPRPTDSPPLPEVTAPDAPVVVPAISVCVDLDAWDARAAALGGTSYSLLAGFAARLGERLGRRRPDDGTVTLSIALNERHSADDTRALAMSFASAPVDPAQAVSDLSGTRSAIRQAIETTRTTSDETLELLPLIPLVPRSALRGLGGLFYGSSTELPVHCSNLGDIDPAIGCPDGTRAEYVLLRGVDQNVSRRDIEQRGGQLVLVSARINGKISIGIVAYQPDAENSKPRLRGLAAQTLADFGLTGLVD
ncbi:hypothetical protein A5740_00390 [Mycobacterium sp. GA-1841]|uniref:hypothetical protein n=1 Tax=Mycobacterium sp. GA-1841 TaxID=1834154 RepID=UPI00096E14B9|nr:hypothetical protein [Mycobacterium sp. GA-1841]OMC35551.1 hypothetical protein A5740_00390 [Mycobacterium sp. GA-1841]